VNRIIKIEKKKLFVAFIDFRKAYDKVNRNLLLYKLQTLGVKGLLYRNIKAIYTSISYIIKCRRGHLQPISSNIGLKQGGVLSPMLFNIYIDDIRHIFDDSCDPVKILKDPISHLLYADDLILLSTTPHGLSRCLSKLELYCIKWKLEVNVEKSKIVIFNPSGRLLNGYIFRLQGQVLENVKSFCYLGIDLSCSGSIRLARLNLMEKARKALCPLKSVISQFNISTANSLKLFQSMIKPITLYNSENLSVFTHHQINAMKEKKTTLLSYISYSKTENVHQKFLKYILGVKSKCSNMASIGELGVYPLDLHGLINLLSFWHRTTQMNNNSLVKQTLNYISENDPSKSEWITTVKYLLDLVHMENYFHNPSLLTTKYFTYMCTKRLKNIFIDQWYNKISGKYMREGQTNKLRTYIVYKKKFVRESYLDNVNNFSVRKVIAKFRCSDHILEIEKGRHNRIKVEDRICKVCTSEVEDELHFLKSCPLYAELRNNYLGGPQTIN